MAHALRPPGGAGRVYWRTGGGVGVVGVGVVGVVGVVVTGRFVDVPSVVGVTERLDGIRYEISNSATTTAAITPNMPMPLLSETRLRS
jgi:hypothetical protein